MNRLNTEFGSFFCAENDLITNHLKEFGAHTRNELVMVLDHIDKDDVVLDIGCHIGTYSVPIAKKLLNGKGHLYCVEADPSTFDLLSRNIIENKLGNVVTPACLLLSNNDELNYRIKKNAGNSGANHFVEDENAADATKTMAFRNYLCRNDINKIDFIKMDVEGMEYILLESIRDVLTSLRPALYIEISEDQLGRYNNTPSQIETLLSDLDYSFFMNTYKRNSTENYYAMSKIRGLSVRRFFDVLALPNN